MAVATGQVSLHRTREGQQRAAQRAIETIDLSRCFGTCEQCTVEVAMAAERPQRDEAEEEASVDEQQRHERKKKTLRKSAGRTARGGRKVLTLILNDDVVGKIGGWLVAQRTERNPDGDGAVPASDPEAEAAAAAAAEDVEVLMAMNCQRCGVKSQDREAAEGGGSGSSYAAAVRALVAEREGKTREKMEARRADAFVEWRRAKLVVEAGVEDADAASSEGEEVHSSESCWQASGGGGEDVELRALRLYSRGCRYNGIKRVQLVMESPRGELGN